MNLFKGTLIFVCALNYFCLFLSLCLQKLHCSKARSNEDNNRMLHMFFHSPKAQFAHCEVKQKGDWGGKLRGGRGTIDD